jgi:hypothetical protein
MSGVKGRVRPALWLHVEGRGARQSVGTRGGGLAVIIGEGRCCQPSRHTGQSGLSHPSPFSAFSLLLCLRGALHGPDVPTQVAGVAGQA